MCVVLVFRINLTCVSVLKCIDQVVALWHLCYACAAHCVRDQAIAEKKNGSGERLADESETNTVPLLTIVLIAYILNLGSLVEKPSFPSALSI